MTGGQPEGNGGQVALMLASVLLIAVTISIGAFFFMSGTMSPVGASPAQPRSAPNPETIRTATPFVRLENNGSPVPILP